MEAIVVAYPNVEPRGPLPDMMPSVAIRIHVESKSVLDKLKKLSPVQALQAVSPVAAVKRVASSIKQQVGPDAFSPPKTNGQVAHTPPKTVSPVQGFTYNGTGSPYRNQQQHVVGSTEIAGDVMLSGMIILLIALWLHLYIGVDTVYSYVMQYF